MLIGCLSDRYQENVISDQTDDEGVKKQHQDDQDNDMDVVPHRSEQKSGPSSMSVVLSPDEETGMSGGAIFLGSRSASRR